VKELSDKAEVSTCKLQCWSFVEHCA